MRDTFAADGDRGLLSRSQAGIGMAGLADGTGWGQFAVVIDRLEVSYCEGWDPQARRAVGPLSSSRAAERDRAGERYALTVAMPGRPLAVIEVAWASPYCAVWFLDEQLRRAQQLGRRFGRVTQVRPPRTGSTSCIERPSCRMMAAELS
jgi:hypothetical protein